MITPQQVAVIKKKLRRGEPEGEIREQLKREGYNAEDIERVFAPRPFDMRSWLLFSHALSRLPAYS